MNDRSLLILLVVTVAFVLYVKPARQNNDLLRTRIALLESQIAAQENIKRQRGGMGGRVKATDAAATANEGYLYPAARSTSLAQVDLQEIIRNAATASHVEVVTSTWGEPVPDEKTGLIRIPMTFTVKGFPAETDQFMKRIFYGGHRFLRAERAGVTKFQDQQLLLSISLAAFKRDGKRE